VALAAVAVGYFVTGLLGLEFASIHRSATPIWPGTGIALASVLLLGRRALGAVFVGSLGLNLVVTGWNGASLAIAAGNTLEASVGGYIIERAAGGWRAFESSRGVFLFSLACVIAAAVAASIGAYSLAIGAGTPGADVGPVWVTWWLGDCVGAILVTPFLVLWLAGGRPRLDRWRLLEGAGTAMLIALAGLAMFTPLIEVRYVRNPMAYLVLPVVVWAGFRFGTRGASSAALLLAVIAVAGTLQGYGPFVGGSPNQSLLLLQSFMGVVAVTAVGMAAVVAERARVVEELRTLGQHLELRVQQRTADLEASEGRFQRFMSHLPGLAWMKAGDGTFVYANPRMARDFGTDQGLVGLADEDLFPPAQAAAHRRSDERVLQTGRPLREEEETVVGGARRHWLVQRFPIEGPDGRRAYVGGIAVEVTDRKEAEAQLQEALNRFQALAEDSPIGVFHTDAEGRVDWANRRWAEIVGHPVGDEEAFRAAVHPDDLGPLEAAWRAARSSGSEMSAEFRYAQPAGRELVLVAHAAAVRDRDGQVTGYVGILMDITERRRAEEERNRARAQAEELEHLRALDRFRTQFINTAAHELRTPLVPLRSLVFLLRQKSAIPEAQYEGSLGVLERNLDRLSALVEDLLLAARHQAGQLKVQREPGDLKAVVDEACASFAEAARERGIRIATAAAGDLGASFDAKRVLQVLYNLLANAMKFTSRGGEVVVTAEGDGDEVRVQVADSGAGLLPSDLERLFQPFALVHDGRRNPQGSGLGLFICKAIVEAHGGSIEAHSDGPGKGFRVSFRLPRSAPAEAVGTAGPAAPPELAPPRTLA
jgi:PAS domain S-box-containing protein